MSTFGYPTDAPCSLQWWGRSGQKSASGRLVSIATDSAEALVDEILAEGLTVKIGIPGYNVKEREAKIVRSGSHGGAGYRIQLSLTGGAWPYEVLSALISSSTSTPTATRTPRTLAATPACLEKLGLTVPCSLEEVEAAYYERVRTAHPDRGGDLETFVELRTAFLQALDFIGGNR